MSVHGSKTSGWSRVLPRVTLALAGVGIGVSAAWAQPRPSSASSGATASEEVVMAMERLAQALRDHPLTAPYTYRLEWDARRGKLVISGVVGTRPVYDAAIRLALESRLPLVDGLVIDTGEAHRVAGQPLRSTPAPAPPYPLLRGVAGPPPLYSGEPIWAGGWDRLGPGLDPVFHGVWTTPDLMYPLGWFDLTRLRRPSREGITPDEIEALEGLLDPTPTPGLPGDSVELLMGRNGLGVLRGVVPTEEIKRELADKARRLPNVSAIINLLRVVPQANPPTPGPVAPAPAPDAQPNAQPGRPIEVPPPPAAEPEGRHAVEPEPMPGDDHDANLRDQEETDLAARVGRVMGRRPELDGARFRTVVERGVVTLDGPVPSAYEAMLAIQAARTTPGVRKVVDRLDFPLPQADDGRDNPLLNRALTDQLEPYLEFQIGRQCDDLLALERVRVEGRVVRVLGAVRSPEDRVRVLAILRSMPLLRGFEVKPEVRVY